MTLIALFGREPELTPAELIRREIDLMGSIGYNAQTFRDTYELLADGRYPTSGWVEHVPVDAVPQALEQLPCGERMKLLVDLPS